MAQQGTNTLKVEPPKPFQGGVNATAIDTWIYQMNLYFSLEDRIPENRRAIRAVMNLAGQAADWFRV